MFNIERKKFGPFANGYWASVVRGYGTYGADQGLWELAVCHGKEMVYDTPITDDVVGYLSWNEVLDLVKKIEALPPRTTPAVAK